MSDETQIEAVVPAPETENTADTESVENDAPGEAETPKSFTQEELDKIVSERLAKAERRFKREQAQAAEQARPVTAPPDPSKFTDVAAYAEALANHRAGEILDQQEANRKRSEVDSFYSERESKAVAKYSDFKAVAYANDHVVTPTMAEVIKASEIGPDVAYWLGQNPDESDRISELSVLSQAREIGKIEAKLLENPLPVKKTSSAPEPIKTVGTRSTTPKYDTTDPRSTASMSDSEWINAERQRQIRKLRAQQG